MALKKTLTMQSVVSYETDIGTVSGGETSLTMKDAYIKIVSVAGSKASMHLTVRMTSDAGMLEKKYRFIPSVADGSENFIRQGYEYLKTLPEFAGAADC